MKTFLLFGVYCSVVRFEFGVIASSVSMIYILFKVIESCVLTSKACSYYLTALRSFHFNQLEGMINTPGQYYN